MCASGLVVRMVLFAIAEYTLAHLHGVEASALHVVLASSSVAVAVVNVVEFEVNLIFSNF